MPAARGASGLVLPNFESLTRAVTPAAGAGTGTGAGAGAGAEPEPEPEPEPQPEPAQSDLPLRVFLASQGLDDMHEPLHELGAECLSDLADVTDAEFAECGIPQAKGEWLRGQAQAVRGKDGEAATPEGGGALAGIPEGVPNEDGGM